MSNLSKQTYDRFLADYQKRLIKPGKTYTQAELCKLLETSTNPLQVALKILEAEGFVEIKARAGVRIRPLDLAVFRETHQLRQILELAGVEHFVSTANDVDIDNWLEMLNRHHELIVKRSDRSEIADGQDELERKLHTSFIDALQSETISKIYATNYRKLRLMQTPGNSMTFDHLLKTSEEHIEIFESIKARDALGAKAALHKHLSSALERAVLSNLNSPNT